MPVSPRQAVPPVASQARVVDEDRLAELVAGGGLADDHLA
jgi:hypothetical protein